jgi:hypothetical protein
MADMATIWQQLLADGQSALVHQDPVKLEKVVQDLIVFLHIQSEIDALQVQVNSITPPDIPNIKVT